MKNSLTLILLLVTVALSAQSVTKDQLIGKWKGVTLHSLGNTSKEELKGLQQMFVNSTFTFLKDGQCKITLAGKGNEDMKEMLANNQWIFDPKTKVIKIGTKEDNFSTIGLTVKVIDGKTYFELLESGTKLEVVKI